MTALPERGGHVICSRDADGWWSLWVQLTPERGGRLLEGSERVFVQLVEAVRGEMLDADVKRTEAA